MQIARLTAAAVTAFVIAGLVNPGVTDLTAALTAMLVVQASSIGTVRMGWLRVLAVLTGVLVAIGISSVVGLNWLSLGIVIALALGLAKVMRLGDQLLETPISAMLILGAGAAGSAAELRLLYTLIGAAVGVAFAVLLPPSLPTRAAASRVRSVATVIADLLDRAGDSMADTPPTTQIVDDWLTEVREVTGVVDAAARMVSLVSDSRKLNPRAIAVQDVGPLLRSGLDCLENCLLAVRALFLLIRAQVPDGADELADRTAASRVDGDLRAVFAVVMHHAAESVRGFGDLILAQAQGRDDQAALSFGLSLEMLREARAILTELMLVDTSDSALWLLRGSTLGAVEQVLVQLNLEDRSRVHRQWQDEQSRRFGAALPELVRDALPHPEVALPRGLERGLRQGRARRRDLDDT